MVRRGGPVNETNVTIDKLLVTVHSPEDLRPRQANL
jgi:hypothetical protein